MDALDKLARDAKFDVEATAAYGCRYVELADVDARAREIVERYRTDLSALVKDIEFSKFKINAAAALAIVESRIESAT